MKKVVNKEITFCDSCGKEEIVSKCLECGAEHCWVCRRIEGVSYKQAVSFSGSYDGYYCNYCDAELHNNKKNKLHSAYITIQKLRKERDLLWIGFEQRTKDTEALIEKLYKK